MGPCLLLFTVFCSACAVAQGQEPSGGQESLEQSCQEVIACSDPLDVLSSDKQELSAVASKEDMDRLCPDIKQHLECIDRRTKSCMAPELQMTFNVLFNGTIVVMTELCHNDSYQQDFLKYASCFKDIKTEEDCEGKYSDTLAEIRHNSEGQAAVQRICCSFQDYLDCTERNVGAVCGLDAGEFHKRMLDTMAISLKAQCVQAAGASTCRALSLASRSALPLMAAALSALLLLPLPPLAA